MNLSKVGELLEDGGVAERNVDHAVVSKSRHGGDAGGFLSSTWRSSGDEETSVLAPERAVLPLTILLEMFLNAHVNGRVSYLATSLVPESLELRREVTVTGGDTEEETIVLLENVRVGEDLRVVLAHFLRASWLSWAVLPCDRSAQWERTSSGGPPWEESPQPGKGRRSHQLSRYHEPQPQQGYGRGRTWSTIAPPCQIQSLRREPDLSPAGVVVYSRRQWRCGDHG